ncbi:MAG TPA: methylmalonyl Co-A mutase-associated GTPase MeaB, partial [Thermoanaerobaculia bacterium]
GYDVVLVETVGVGQAEVVVAEMVDFVVLLLLPGAGDELQGIKRGILEHVDLVAVNKADGDHALAAREARAQYEAALRFVRPPSPLWTPPVVTASGLHGEGLDELWTHVEEHRRVLSEAGELAERRRRQQRRWMWSLIEDELLAAFRRDPRVASLLPGLEDDVAAGRTTATLAARRLLEIHGRS